MTTRRNILQKCLHDILSYEFDWPRKIFANCLKLARQYMRSSLGLLRKTSSNTILLSHRFKPFFLYGSSRYFLLKYSDSRVQQTFLPMCSYTRHVVKKLYTASEMLRFEFLIHSDNNTFKFKYLSCIPI